MSEKQPPENDRKPLRIVDAARELGLSASTVSRAFSGRGRVSEDTRRRVVEWTQKNAWLPDVMTRTLQFGRSGNIAVLLPTQPSDEVTPFFHYFVLGACETAAAHNYDVIVMSAGENEAAQLEALAEKNKIDGLVLTDRENDAVFDIIEQRGIPGVFLGTQPRSGLVRVGHDTTGSCCELTSILLDNGLRRIAYLGGNNQHLVNQHRRQGFIDGFKIRGLQHDASLVFTDMDSTPAIEQAVLRMLERGVQGVLTGDDVICSRLMAVLHWLGVKIPDEMQVGSFHHSFLMDIQSPQVSCVKIDPKRQSIQATKLLFALMEGEAVPEMHMTEHEILVRGSTRRNLNTTP